MIGRTVERVWCTSLGVLVVCAALIDPGEIRAAPVAVRHPEGLVHGFLVLRTLAGDTLADGDLIQVASGDRVTSRLVFHFKDGSLHDETAVFSQRGNFRLLSDRLIQKGPAFQHPMEVSIDASTGRVTVHTTGDDGKDKVAQRVRSLAESPVVQPLAACSTGSSTIEPSCKAAWPAMETGSSMRRTIKPTASQASKMRL